MKIFLGPAGVPISSVKRDTISGLEKVSELKLNAMEIQFVRGVKIDNKIAKEVGEIAKNLNVNLSVHCPYFINLCSQEKMKLKASKKRILDSVERAHFMNAHIAVFHPGYYGKLTKEKALESIKEACKNLSDGIKEKGMDVKLGLETMGKQATFGTLEEIIEICKEVRDCKPVIDFAHINCRTAGSLKTQADYAKIFDKLEVLKLNHLHCHFTGAEYSSVGIGKGNERYHLELKSNKPPFLPLAKEILKRKLDITIISESPVLESDSLHMIQIFEKLGYKF